MAADPFAAIEESAKAVAALTGIRSQFIEAGWSEVNAELAVIEMIRLSIAQAKAKG